MNVLVVEDSPTHAGLVELTLQRFGEGRFVVEKVETLAAAMQRLRAKGIDIVLLDLSLPDSNGLDTVRRVVDADFGVPVVVMTANTDEANAFAAMGLGVQDYLIKGQDRGYQIIRSIRYSLERSKIEQRIRASEQRFRDYAEVAADWFWETDGEGRVVFFSAHASERLGVDVAAQIGLPLPEFFARAGADSGHLAALQASITGVERVQNRILHLAAGGFISISGKPTFNRDETFTGYHGVATDVTDRCAAEYFAQQMLAIMSEAMNAIPQGVAVFDEGDVLLACNDHIFDCFPGCGDLFIPGQTFPDILQAAIRRGVFAGGEATPEWLATWDAGGNGNKIKRQPIRTGQILEVSQYPTARGGSVRTVALTEA